MSIKLIALAGATVAAISGTAATAAPVTTAFTLAASVFNDAVHSPYQAVTGNFTLSFDNAADIAPTSSGLTVSNFTLSGFASQFRYVRSSDTLYIGTALATADPTALCSVSSYADQYCLTVQNASTALPMPAQNNPFFYNVSSSNGPFFSTVTALTPQVAAPVPELASWAMLVGGVGVVGSAMRRRRVRVSFS